MKSRRNDMKNLLNTFFIKSWMVILTLILPAFLISFSIDTGDEDGSEDLKSILRTSQTSKDKSDDKTSKEATSSVKYLYAFPNATPNSKEIASADSYIAQESANTTPSEDPSKTVLINFNNVSIIEYLRFISRITNKNFVFDENDLQFNVTIVSEEPATIDNIMTALLQELRIHDLMMIEEGNNLIIHKNPKVNAISKVVTEDLNESSSRNSDIITRVFRMNTLDAEKAAAVLRPLMSEFALIEVVMDSNNMIITDIADNVDKAALLLKSIDAPNSGLVIGQYVSRLTPIDTLIPLAQQIMQPISLDQPLTFVPQQETNSIFIVSSPFLVERTISILQYLDEDQGATRILNLKDLRLGGAQIKPRGGTSQLPTTSGSWVPDGKGGWIFKPNGTQGGEIPPAGGWSKDQEGKWDFNPNGPGGQGPKGRWVLDKNGNWVYELSGDESFNPGHLARQFTGGTRLPGGIEKKTQFFIYKLQYRKGDSVEKIIRQIADTLQQNEKGNEDFINALRSVQWLDTTNSLVFSGMPDALDKVNAIVKEIDKPMRQVFVEMLLLDTTISDALNYGVAIGSRFGGGDVAGSQLFYSGSTPLSGSLKTVGLSNLGSTIGNQQVLVPDPTNLAQSSGFNLGVIGQKITHCGTEFGSLAALVSALHDRSKDKVVMNPKVLIEDNTPATLFVGINTPYRTQSISNDRGSVLTSNFEYRDVGTTLKITPYLGNGDIVTLDIEQEDSTIIAGLITNADTAATSPGPTTRINRTKTRVHIPDGFFLIISGMVQHEDKRERDQIPCLGGVPLLGAGFSDKRNRDDKRNLIIFIRPKIVDTEEEIQEITRRQQDIYDYKNCLLNYDEYEWQEALDLFNITKTLHPEDERDCELYGD